MLAHNYAPVGHFAFQKRERLLDKTVPVRRVEESYVKGHSHATHKVDAVHNGNCAVTDKAAGSYILTCYLRRCLTFINKPAVFCPS